MRKRTLEIRKNILVILIVSFVMISMTVIAVNALSSVQADNVLALLSGGEFVKAQPSSLLNGPDMMEYRPESSIEKPGFRSSGMNQDINDSGVMECRPASSIEKLELPSSRMNQDNISRNAHTHLMIMVPKNGTAIYPVSNDEAVNNFSIEKPESLSSGMNQDNISRVAHTHLRILVPKNGTAIYPVSNTEAVNNLRNLSDEGDSNNTATAIPNALSSINTATAVPNTPSSIACIYKLATQPTRQSIGCNPSITTVNPMGGGGAIAIVDAYDDPSAVTDMVNFSTYFGLPAADFKVIYAGGSSPYINGSRPPSGVRSGWAFEEVLDTEWAHAMAPKAKIFLVEAQNNNQQALYTAIKAAQYLVSQNGGGEISMSWGSSEYSSETSDDSIFNTSTSLPNVTYIASSGDEGSIVNYPAASPYVIGVGGTTINRDASGNFVNETTWENSGGGNSQNELRPSFQNIASVEKVVGSQWGTPDLSMVANPSSGVSGYLSRLVGSCWRH